MIFSHPQNCSKSLSESACIWHGVEIKSRSSRLVEKAEHAALAQNEESRQSFLSVASAITSQ